LTYLSVGIVLLNLHVIGRNLIPESLRGRWVSEGTADNGTLIKDFTSNTATDSSPEGDSQKTSTFLCTVKEVKADWILLQVTISKEKALWRIDIIDSDTISINGIEHSRISG
jgi:hypothetical protein